MLSFTLVNSGSLNKQFNTPGKRRGRERGRARLFQSPFCYFLLLFPVARSTRRPREIVLHRQTRQSKVPPSLDARFVWGKKEKKTDGDFFQSEDPAHEKIRNCNCVSET